MKYICDQHPKPPTFVEWFEYKKQIPIIILMRICTVDYINGSIVEVNTDVNAAVIWVFLKIKAYTEKFVLFVTVCSWRAENCGDIFVLRLKILALTSNNNLRISNSKLFLSMKISIHYFIYNTYGIFNEQNRYKEENHQDPGFQLSCCPFLCWIWLKPVDLQLYWLKDSRSEKIAIVLIA